MADTPNQELTDTLAKLAAPFDDLAQSFTGLPQLADSIRKGEFPITTPGMYENAAQQLINALQAVRKFIRDEQNKATS